jgi:hypothetical protein
LRHFIRLLTAKQVGPPPWVHPPLLASDYIYIYIWFVWRIVAIFPLKKLEKKLCYNFLLFF